MTLKDQVAVVTGGSRGIGKAIVQALAREGARVAFVYKGSAEAAKSLEAEVAASGGVARAHQGDVADPAAAERIVGAVLAEWGRVDILVNNAGVIRDKLFLQMEADDWNAVLGTNLGGAFAFCKAVAKQMAFKQRSGRIINVSSGLARFAVPGTAAYAMMKGGIEVFTRLLAKELGPRRITANTVAPGAIETDFNGGHLRDDANVNRMVAQTTALGRPGQADDVGPVIASLLSDDNHWVNAQRIEVSGGMNI